MPELPEVEATLRAVAPVLEGRRIVHVDVARSRMLRRQQHPDDFVSRLPGCIIKCFARRGKFLFAELSRDLTWVTHLGMSGRVRLATRSDLREPHTNVVVRVGRGVEFRLIDPRMFGFVAVFTRAELDKSTLRNLGPDAWSEMPSTQDFGHVLTRRSASIKSLLLDQRILAGVGNIYADEALHAARVNPHRAGDTLTMTEISTLRKAIRSTLAAGIRGGGTSLDDLAYRLPDGRAGRHFQRLRAYGREGKPCQACGEEIRRDVIRQRSSYWCPACQV